MSRFWPPGNFLPPGIWDNPSAEDRQAYENFVEAWVKGEAEYHAYYRSWLEGQTVESVHALASCTTSGTNTETGHQLTVQVSGSVNDGQWTSHAFDSTQTAFGGYYVVYADSGLDLPEHEGDLQPAEPILSSQDLGGHAVNGFYRFLDVALPQGATINYAKLRFVAQDQDAGTDSTITLTVAAEKTTSSSSPVSSISDATSRTKTTNQRTWIDTLVLDAGGIDTSFDSTNIACVVQELVDQTGWSSGGHMQFFVLGSSADSRYHQPYDYSQSTTNAAQLLIWYSLVVNETGSGGVKANGQSTQRAIYRPTITAAGAKLGGSGYSSFKDIVEVGGGAKVNGAATESYINVTHTYNETGSGGAKVNGVATESYINATGVYDEVGSGGAKVGGDSMLRVLYKPEIPGLYQAVRNSKGELGTNANFSSFTYDGTEYPTGSSGSFLQAGGYVNVQSSDFESVDTRERHFTSVVAKHGDADGSNYDPSNKQYVGVACYDADQNFIQSWFVSRVTGSADATLTAPLNNGDSTMQVSNTTGWYNTVNTAYYNRQIGWWPFTDGQGTTYEPYTYTRNSSMNYSQYGYGTDGLWAGGGINGNVITLAVNWVGPNLPAGTPVWNAGGGSAGTYNYCTVIAQTFPNEWTRYTGYLDPPIAGSDTNNRFRFATKYARILFLANYPPTASSNVRFADVRLEFYLHPRVGGSATYNQVSEFTYSLEATGGASAGGELDAGGGRYNETMDGGVVASGVGSFSLAYTGIEPLQPFTVAASLKHATNRKPNCRPNIESPQFRGLVGWWPADAPGGTFVYDPIASSNGEILNYTDAAWSLDTTRGGYVIDLANSRFVDCGPTHNLAFTNDQFTVSIWVRPRSFSNNPIIWNKENLYELGFDSNGYIQWAVRNTSPGWTWITTSYQATLNNWYHVVLVYDGSKIRTYINGIQKHEYNASGNVRGDLYPHQDFRIGGREASPGSYLLDGLVDDCRVYNRALTAAETQQVYNPQTRWDLWEQETLEVFFTQPYGDVGGLQAGGNATEGVKSSVAGTGGAQVDGSALAELKATVSPSGGVKTNGIWSIVAAYSLSTSGGVETGGEASIAGKFAVYMPEGGARVGGSGDESFNDIAEVGGGIKTNGSSVETLDSQNASFGGVEVGGQATEYVIYTERSQAGVTVGGSSQENTQYEIEPSGGAITDGTTDPTATYNPIATGGSTIGGTALEGSLYSIDTAGGVIVGGRAAQPISEVARGGVVVGGETSAVHEEVGQGEAAVGGEAAAGISRPIDITGGLVTGGESEYFAIFNPDLSETKFQFFARYNQVSEYELSTQESMDGVYPPSHSYEPLVYIAVDTVNNRIHWRVEHPIPNLDSIRFRGPAEKGETGETVFVVSGSMTSPVIGSRAITATQAQQILDGLWYIFIREWTVSGSLLMRGQIVNEPMPVGGSATVGLGWVAEGGVVVEGTTVVIHKAVASGEILVGGEATVQQIAAVVPSGGVEINGTSGLVHDARPPISGGVEVGGQTVPQGVYSTVAESGAEVGIPTGTSSIQPAISGGVSVNGTITEQITRNVIASGGALIAGESDVDFYDYETGRIGILVGGSAVVKTPVASHESDGLIITIGGEAGVRRLNFFRYYPDGNIVLVDGTSDSYYGFVHEATGGIIIDGDAFAGITSYHYNPTGQVVIGGPADAQLDAAAMGGVSAGGAAKVNTADFGYQASDGILVEHTDETFTDVLYRYNPTGGIILGGPALARVDGYATGGLKTSGLAAINERHYIYEADGGLIVDGENQITELTGKYTGDGVVVISGSARVLPGNYSYVADGGITLHGYSDFAATFVDQECADVQFRCVVQYPNPHVACPEIKFYYAECEVYLDDPFCQTISGAMVAPIIACRQRLIMPPKDRRPDIPKRRC